MIHPRPRDLKTEIAHQDAKCHDAGGPGRNPHVHKPGADRAALVDHRHSSKMKLVAASLFGFLLLAAVNVAQGQDECEFVLTANVTTQHFSTPNFPNQYPNHLSCVWIIKAPNPDQHVEVLFDTFVTEACCDFVHIRDGESSTSPILIPISGNQTQQPTVVSTYDALRISFTSDDSNTFTGFRAEYRIAVVSDPECGGEILAPISRYEDVSSPGYPNTVYPANSFCLYTITADPGYVVVASVRSYQMERCCDNVLVRDGSGPNARSIAYFSGRSTRPSTIVSSGNSMQIRFRSNGQNNLFGFVIKVRAALGTNTIPTQPEDPECGSELLAPASGHANFSSPNYRNPYPNSVECVWIIRAPEGERVRVWFSYINTEKCCDWIKVRDGAEFDSPKLGVASGNPGDFKSYVSSSDTLRVEFDSDASVTARGFFAYYEIYDPELDSRTSKCGEDLDADLTPQYFSSPGFPNGTYPHDAYCLWLITSPFGTKVRVMVLGVILENYHDVLSFYNGNSVASSRIVGLTGKHSQKFRITASGNQMLVVLQSDGSVSHAGFRATYVAVENEMDEGLDEKSGDPK